MRFAEELTRRRERLSRRVSAAAVLLVSAPRAIRSNDDHYPYRQDSDFHYLTGFDEPEAVALLLPGENRPRYLLFVRPRDPVRETWDGRRSGVEGAVSVHGADEAFPIGELGERLPLLLEGIDTVYLPFGRDDELAAAVRAAVRRARAGRQRRGTGPVAVRDSAAEIGEARLVKSPFEIDLLRRACAITCEAHELVMRSIRPGERERDAEAILDYAMRRRGASDRGYPHIVAGGANATILHYNENQDTLSDGDLLLIDAGAECELYSADVTRTFPVGRAFTREQRTLYDLVLSAQKEALSEIAPGRPFDAYHKRALRVLTAGLVELGILAGEVDELIEKEAFKPFYMHRTGHWLGLDVHDAGLYTVAGAPRPLEPGMVLTVEPGLYFGEWCGEVDSRWKGIGVRIEDDVLVTEQGYENLTAACPKEPAELERRRREAMERDPSAEPLLPPL
jgi:Xaa-Pro aminopeptidase